MGQDSRATIHCFVGFDDECYEVGCKIVFYVIQYCMKQDLGTEKVDALKKYLTLIFMMN